MGSSPFDSLLVQCLWVWYVFAVFTEVWEEEGKADRRSLPKAEKKTNGFNVPLTWKGHNIWWGFVSSCFVFHGNERLVGDVFTRSQDRSARNNAINSGRGLTFYARVEMVAFTSIRFPLKCTKIWPSLFILQNFYAPMPCKEKFIRERKKGVLKFAHYPLASTFQLDSIGDCYILVRTMSTDWLAVCLSINKKIDEIR